MPLRGQSFARITKFLNSRVELPLWVPALVQSLIAVGLLLLLAFVEKETGVGFWVVFSSLLLFLLVSALVTHLGWRANLRAQLESDLLNQALEGLPHPRLIVGPDGETIFANAMFVQKFNPGAENHLNVFFDYIAGDPAASRAIKSLQATVSTGSSQSVDLKLRQRHGQVEWLSVGAYSISERPGYVMWSIEDITERLLIEERLRNDQEALFEFVESAPVGFYSVDGDGKFIFINKTLADWLGTTPEEVIGGDFHLHDFIVSALPPQTVPYDPSGQDSVGTSLPTTIIQHENVSLCGHQGRVLQVQISQNCVLGLDGQLTTRSVVHDVTSERELERALRQSVHRFQRFFDAAPGGIAQLDLSGRIVECNQAFRKLVADGGGEVTGGLLADLIVDEERPKIEQLLSSIVDGVEEGALIEVTLGDGEKDTPLRVASFFASRLEDDDGDLTGLIIHGLDTTELKHLQIQFTQSQKMQAVGQLAGGIAHDFNNLLTAMIGFCDLLLQRHRPGEQSFADIMQIKQNANRAANLVRQLLAFSRQQTVSSKVLNVTEVLVDLSHLLRRLIGETIQLKISHGRNLGLVKADQGQLEQVIVNLAVNARDAMSEGGTLSISTENVSLASPERLGTETLPAGDYIRLEVADTGMGMDKNVMERIFDPFFSTKEVGLGTGLGLSTVIGIIKQSDGFISVASTPEEGSVFAVLLPRHHPVESIERPPPVDTGEAPPVDTGEAPPVRDLTGVGTVLLVEDEDAVRLFSARALRNKGYNVLEARSGNTAIELIRRTEDQIDLLITDVVMPDMDGPALIEWIRGNRPGMKVICISGYAEESFRNVLDHSADIHFLPKPFNLEELAGKVKEVF